jgi:hypothetical protein
MKYYIALIASILVAALIGYNIGHLRGSVFGMNKGIYHARLFIDSIQLGMKQNVEKIRYDIVSAKGDLNDVEIAQMEFNLEIDRIIKRLEDYKELHSSKP